MANLNGEMRFVEILKSLPGKGMTVWHVFKHHRYTCADLSDLHIEDLYFRTLQENCPIVTLLSREEMKIDYSCLKSVRIDADDCVYPVPVF